MEAARRDLHATRDKVLSGAPGAPSPRTAIAASWRRVAACGLAPGSEPEIAPLPVDEVTVYVVALPVTPVTSQGVSC